MIDNPANMVRVAALAQAALRDVAGLIEQLYVVASGRDILASLFFYLCALGVAGFTYLFGVGAALWVALAWALRPPLLRGIPGLLGWRPFLVGLPGRAAADDARQLPAL